VQEYLYAGSRLLVISPPYGVSGPPFITNSQGTIVVSESAGWVRIPVKLTNLSDEPTTGEVRVKYATSSGSALAGSDFTQTSGVLVFPPAQSASGTTLEIEVPILDDRTSEPQKTFAVVLSDPKGADLVSPTSRTIVIEDDDPAPPAGPSGEPL
jgi:Calx-beta domain